MIMYNEKHEEDKPNTAEIITAVGIFLAMSNQTVNELIVNKQDFYDKVVELAEQGTTPQSIMAWLINNNYTRENL